MKRLNSEPDLECFQVKKCKLPDSIMDNSAKDLSPPPGPTPRGPSMEGEADIELRRVMDNFVNVYEQLGKCNGSNVKPNYSYTELAYLAMLRSPNFCLPITEIYRYIQSRFDFFKNSTRKHWKNAVRHSLAKTLCFSKITVGRGKSSSENLSRSTYLWCIIPSSIASFARGDYRPSLDKDSGSNSLRWGYYRVNAGQFWDQVGNYLATKMLTFKKALDTSPDPGLIFESQICQIPQSLVLPKDTKPLTSVPIINNIPADTVQFSETLSRVYRCPPTGAPPPYPGMENNREAISHQFKQVRHVQLPVKTVTYRELTSTPESSRPYTHMSPKMEILSPESRYKNTTMDRQTPSHMYDYHDSGNESTGCESSPEECRVLSSCRQQQFAGSSPVLNLALLDCSPAKNDLSDIDISPFEIPELSDFSYIVSPQSDLPSPTQDVLFNDSGCAINFSSSCDVNSPRSFTETSCQFASNMRLSPFSLSPPSFVSDPSPQLVRGSVPQSVREGVPQPLSEGVPQPLRGSVPQPLRDSVPQLVRGGVPQPLRGVPQPLRDSDSLNFGNHFISNFDPMFSPYSGQSAWRL